jgi:hypothetical protein
MGGKKSWRAGVVSKWGGGLNARAFSASEKKERKTTGTNERTKKGQKNGGRKGWKEGKKEH